MMSAKQRRLRRGGMTIDDIRIELRRHGFDEVPTVGGDVIAAWQHPDMPGDLFTVRRGGSFRTSCEQFIERLALRRGG